MCSNHPLDGCTHKGGTDAAAAHEDYAQTKMQGIAYTGLINVQGLTAFHVKWKMVMLDRRKKTNVDFFHPSKHSITIPACDDHCFICSTNVTSRSKCDHSLTMAGSNTGVATTNRTNPMIYSTHALKVTIISASQTNMILHHKRRSSVKFTITMSNAAKKVKIASHSYNF